MHLLAFNGLRIAEALNADIDHLGYDRGHRALRIKPANAATAGSSHGTGSGAAIRRANGGSPASAGYPASVVLPLRLRR